MPQNKNITIFLSCGIITDIQLELVQALPNQKGGTEGHTNGHDLYRGKRGTGGHGGLRGHGKGT